MDPPLNSEFVALDNFRRSGGENFQNTCFIAVVANLRHVHPQVMSYVQDHTWTSFVRHCRSLRDENDALIFSARDGNGQHDATLLLGQIIPADPMKSGYGVQIQKIKVLFCCKDSTPSEEFQAMLPLLFPTEIREYRLGELLDDYQEPEHLFDLECDFCLKKGEGTFTRNIHTGLNGKMVLRIGRYSPAGKRNDRLILDPVIWSKDESCYRLEAILEHSGSTISNGHYIIYLLINGHWEKRNDAVQTFFDETGGPLRYKPSNVQ